MEPTICDDHLPGGRSHGVTTLVPKERLQLHVEFRGKNRADAKRLALNYWYSHRAKLNLDVRGFSDRCRLQPDDRTILFYPLGQAPVAQA